MKTRANWLPASGYFNLNAACAIINSAFEGGFGCYLVGSSMERRDFRDVDVRYIMGDAEFDRMFPCGGDRAHSALWSLMCLSISLYLSQQSGLPVDFQIQRQTNANADNEGRPRSALGVFLAYPGKFTPAAETVSHTITATSFDGRKASPYACDALPAVEPRDEGEVSGG